MPESFNSDAGQHFRIHLLDVGEERYGDSILCQFGDTSVLIDGGHSQNVKAQGDHPSIPDQLGKLLGQQPPYRVSLLVVTHAHSDHIGCLPKLVQNNLLTADWALVADPDLGWGKIPDDTNPTDAADAADAAQIAADFAQATASPQVLRLVSALREESWAAATDAEISAFLDEVANQEDSYRAMIDTLQSREHTKVVRYGRDDLRELLQQFSNTGLEVLGPSDEQLRLCAEVIKETLRSSTDEVSSLLAESDTAD
ncbi:MAG TPA: MBL fold metallo-hydrolase [Chloroflexia bacterium]|jgi:hypothetical protein